MPILSSIYRTRFYLSMEYTNFHQHHRCELMYIEHFCRFTCNAFIVNKIALIDFHCSKDCKEKKKQCTFISWKDLHRIESVKGKWEEQSNQKSLKWLNRFYLIAKHQLNLLGIISIVRYILIILTESWIYCILPVEWIDSTSSTAKRSFAYGKRWTNGESSTCTSSSRS